LADDAEKVAAAVLLLAKHPVISVNGNVVALVAEEIIALSEIVPSRIEVNLFHRTDDRISRLVSRMEEVGGTNILGVHASARIPGLAHDRGWCEVEGIFAADVVLVPLEDGDRCQALREMGKTVVTIDLNPLSRTARTAQVTIVDNVVRAIPRICFWVKQLKKESEDVLQAIKDDWDNEVALKEVINVICSRFQKD
jgi:4-phosphopantoate--beta-alanine ligase